MAQLPPRPVHRPAAKRQPPQYVEAGSGVAILEADTNPVSVASRGYGRRKVEFEGVPSADKKSSTAATVDDVVETLNPGAGGQHLEVGYSP